MRLRRDGKFSFDAGEICVDDEFMFSKSLSRLARSCDSS